MTIDWSQVEVGDVVEWRNDHRENVYEFRLTNGLPPVLVNGLGYELDGRSCWADPRLDIVAIHKPGTVGAMSHEERSRLWDKMGEHLISVCYAKPNLVEAFTDGIHATGETPLEAVAKCVAAIEQKENANG